MSMPLAFRVVQEESKEKYMAIAGLRLGVARLGRLACALGIGAALMAACTTNTRAPVVDLAGGADVGAASVPSGQATYVVRPGDTLYSIARQHQVSWEDVARWNNIHDPSQLRVGTTLRVGTGDASTVAQASGAQVQPIASTNVESRPLDGAAATPGSSQRPTPDTTSGINWAWPASGEVIDGFNESLNKGIDIQGEVGDPVMATADGVVVYAGSGLRGYGNLLIVRHDSTFLSAYAHNSRLLVAEGDKVSRGQTIAELGQSDAPSPRLHFEIRRGGTPEDPMRFLPPR